VSGLRCWSEEGATADESSVLEASRRERPPSNARAQTLTTLGVAAAVTTVVMTTSKKNCTRGSAVLAGDWMPTAGAVFSIGTACPHASEPS
jgi:hypothetical protein